MACKGSLSSPQYTCSVETWIFFSSSGLLEEGRSARHCGLDSSGIFSPQFLFCLIPLCQVRPCKTDPITLKLCRKTGGNTRGYSQKCAIRYERVGISVILVYKLKGQRANKLIYDIKKSTKCFGFVIESYFKDSAVPFAVREYASFGRCGDVMIQFFR